MNDLRKNVLYVMDELDKLSSENVDYGTFELALVLFLRSDKFEVQDKSHVTDEMLKNIDKLVSHADSLMSDDLKDAVDEELMLF